jgi:hypothetical protein
MEDDLELQTYFKEYSDNPLKNFPEIIYSNLYKKVQNNFHFEFVSDKEKYLFSPIYTLLIGEPPAEFRDFLSQNNSFFDSLKNFIINSLFIYSAIIEENTYYITDPQNITIARVIPHGDGKFELKFYSHYKDELQNSYSDKIYIGRDFINILQFERKYLGLKSFYFSFIEQNKKIQERAKHKLRYYKDYKKPYLNEIDYSVKEMVSDSIDRIKMTPETKISDIRTVKLIETLDNILYLQNLMTELRELNIEFENKLRMNKEIGFAKYLTKFSKDLKNGILYLRKLSTHMHLRISGFPIWKC